MDSKSSDEEGDVLFDQVALPQAEGASIDGPGVYSQRTPRLARGSDAAAPSSPFQVIGDPNTPIVTGGYTIYAVGAVNKDEQTPADLCVFRRVSKLHFTLRHRDSALEEQACFRFVQSFDGYGIHGATIEFEQAGSSTLGRSTLLLRFAPSPFGSDGTPVRGIVFSITGTWAPGDDEIELSGRLIVRGDGKISLHMVHTEGMVTTNLFENRARLVAGGIGKRRGVKGSSMVPEREARDAKAKGPRLPKRHDNGLDVYLSNGSSQLRASAQREIVAWYHSLTARTQLLLRSGEWGITLTAFGCRKGDEQTNLALARRSAQMVSTFLRALIGSNARFDIEARVESSPRRVEIRIPIG